ncbi:MAG: glycosyltransferase family 39 protein [Anaerolineales bacterium]
MSFFPSWRIPSIRNNRIYISLLLGIAFGIVFGLSVYSYWLIDIISSTSKRTILYTILIALGGAAGYFFILDLWVIPRLLEMQRSPRWKLIGCSILTAVLLMFAGTSAWRSSSRYITFFLPTQSLKITVSSPKDISNSGVNIWGVETSIGNVPYNAMNYQGWKRNEYQLDLIDSSKNSLEWTGVTGGQAQIFLNVPSQTGWVIFSWNGNSQTINFSSAINGKLSYTEHFIVPFYASRAMVLLLVFLNFIVVCCAINLLIWEKRIAIQNYLHRSTLTLSYRTSYESAETNHAKEGKPIAFLGWIAAMGIVVIAFLLRAFNLESLPPYTDEYAHLIAAKAIVLGAPLNAVYQRSLYMVTLPVAFFFRVFGVELWTARLTGVLFNVLAIIPLYLITKKINRQVAILSCILYATSPWIIAVSRNVREYAYYPFYFYWIIYGMVLFIERFPDHFVLGNFKKTFDPKTAFLGIALALPPIYSIIVDPDSTFKVILIAYIVGGLFLLAKFDLKSKINLWFLAVLGIGLIVGGEVYLTSQQGSVALYPVFNSDPLRFFFFNPEQQWYFNRLTIIPALLSIGAIVISLLSYQSNFIPSFLISLYFAGLSFFVFFFRRTIHPRYIFNLQFWYILPIAIGLYSIWALLQAVLPRIGVIKLLVTFIAAVLFFNAVQVLLPTFYNRYGYMPITGEYHDEVRPVYSFMLDKVEKSDVLISTIYGSYVRWIGMPKFETLYSYEPEKSQKYVYSIIKQNKTGWIVLDTRRSSPGRPLPRETISIEGKEVEYIGEFADQYLWMWKTENTSP